MPFEEEQFRARLERRAHQARMNSSAVPEERFPVQPRDSEGLLVRDNARFDDLTGQSILGFSSLDTMTT